MAKRQTLVADVFKRFAKSNPNPKCELFYKTPYQLLVSVVLSAQATDKVVNRCMEPVYKKGFSPKTVENWGEKRLLETIRSIGLAPTKAKNIVRLTAILLEKHGGKVPADRDSLEALPGVGRKTANVLLGELFGGATLAVDTHVFRVTRRLGLHHENSPDKCEQEILKTIDNRFLPRAHHWFVLHGRYICKSAKPLCDQCPLADICPSLKPGCKTN